MKVDFLKHRYIFFAIPLIIIIVGFVCGFTTGFKFDVDFKGGITIQTDLGKNFDNNEIEKLVNDAVGQKPLVQKLGTDTSSLIITCDELSEEQVDKITSSLKEKYPDMKEPSVRNVKPSYGKELLNSALLALVVSVVLLLLYISIRFKTLGVVAAITAIIGLVNNVLVVTALYGIFKLPINSTFVAVILTIIGYAINDTIIVYDRIRENKRKITRSANMKDTVNLSINQTLRRTIYTSITTIIAIGVVYVLALINNQEVLKQFSLPLIIGVMVGTYSSIFVASSLWCTIEEIIEKKKQKNTKNNVKETSKNTKLKKVEEEKTENKVQEEKVDTKSESNVSTNKSKSKGKKKKKSNSKKKSKK